MNGNVLAGRHVLIAAAGEGLGRELAVGLAAEGANVSVTTRHSDVAEEVTANSILNECWSYGRDGHALRIELTDLDAVSSALEQLEQDLSPIDVLINLAFDLQPTTKSEITAQDWSTAIGNGAEPAFVLARAIGPLMCTRRKGCITSVLPTTRNTPSEAPVRAARAAVVGLCEGLDSEWKNLGISVMWTNKAPALELITLLKSYVDTETQTS